MARGVKPPLLLLTADAAVIAALAAAIAAAALRGEDARGAAAGNSPLLVAPIVNVEGRLNVEPKGVGGRVNFDEIDNPGIAAAVGVVATGPGLASVVATPVCGIPSVEVVPPTPPASVS